MNRIVFGADDFASLPAALEREWLETNGLGSFASGTLAGAATRRYHGLLVSATRPPIGRMHLVGKLFETVHVGGAVHALGTGLYPGAVHPEGYRSLIEVETDPLPRWVFRLGETVIEKRLFMPHGSDAVVVQYRLAAGPPEATLELLPVMSGRDFHGATRQNSALDAAPRAGVGPGHVYFQPYPGVPAIHLYAGACRFDPALVWFRNFEYPVELERGLPGHEDGWSPGRFVGTLTKNKPLALVFSAGPFRPEDPEATPDPARLLERELKRRRAAAGPFAGRGGLLEALARASGHFFVRRGEGASLIAGYPWFEDWGRDTFISLPGLALTMERTAEARAILVEFGRHIADGLVPNRFPDASTEPEYNTVDAPLWYINAVGRYLEASDDLDAVEAELLPAVESIVEGYVEGTRHGIGLDRDGLVRAGEPGRQLTWMDAKVGDRVITPRSGKPVEIQALWHNALRTLESLHLELDNQSKAQAAGARADRAAAAFVDRFWDAARNCCADVVDSDETESGIDSSLRPNQLLAGSLPHPVLDSEKTRRMVDVVRRELLTPRGLRTLAPSDPRYRGRYTGSPTRRDEAYHQGTVWPWLIGPYIDALVHAHGGWRPDVIREARAILAGFEEHLREAGIGTVSEIFEGDAPHRPAGCPAQAWSVAELLRVAAEVDRHG